MARSCMFSVVAICFIYAENQVVAVHVRKGAETGSNYTAAFASKKSTFCGDNNYGCCQQNEESKMQQMGMQQVPMVLFARGCTGSTATLHMIQDLTELGGQDVLHCGGSYELTKDIQVGHFGRQNTTLAEGISNFLSIAGEKRRRLLYKDELKYAGNDKAMMRFLKEQGAIFIDYDRLNKLDIGLCSVKDCFKEYTPLEFGYLVRNNDRVDHCEFRGRGVTQSEEETKVHVNIENLLSNLRRLQEVKANTTSFLKENAVLFESASYEALFAFDDKSNRRGVGTSIQAWKKVMHHFNVHLSVPTIRSYLNQKRMRNGKRKDYRDQIANFDEVKAALDSCTGEDCKEVQRMLEN